VEEKVTCKYLCWFRKKDFLTNDDGRDWKMNDDKIGINSRFELFLGNLSVPEGGKETTIEEEMKTAEEVIEIDTTEVTTTWGEAAAPTLIEVHQEAIEVVAEICHIVRMAVDHPEITMVTVITHTALIDTAIMSLEAKEETGKLFSILYLQLTNFLIRSRSYDNHRGGGKYRSRSRSFDRDGGRGYNGGNRGPPRGEFNGNQGSNPYMMPGENRDGGEQGGPADMNRPPPNMPSSNF
jgi:hypothetical protein